MNLKIFQSFLVSIQGLRQFVEEILVVVKSNFMEIEAVKIYFEGCHVFTFVKHDHDVLIEILESELSFSAQNAVANAL